MRLYNSKSNRWKKMSNKSFDKMALKEVHNWMNLGKKGIKKMQKWR